MIYWHVGRRASSIYSSMKACSSSEVAAMSGGVLRHCTALSVEKNNVDTHGQSEPGFAFTHLLGFDLLPRLKDIAGQKLYLPDLALSEQLPLLKPVAAQRAIRWELIGVTTRFAQNCTLRKIYRSGQHIFDARKALSGSESAWLSCPN